MGTGHVLPSTISAVQMYFGRFISVWIIFKCKISKISLQAQTDPEVQNTFGRPSTMWPVSARH
ncbi:hypothetical protein RHMOL_Rhmol02G0299900 [Rhododendron molle]|uniref:Uncharacterized protein n=1 Tax=Rhododendron molle TaxID=49168 RepID=A0ACC0PX34_RHOML|nr:hypothetical protein RHMOL_Rhmol02G0299900 [Rhododendron molle]